MYIHPRPNDLPSIETVNLMLQCGHIDGVQIHQCLEKSEIMIFKDHKLWYEVKDQHCRDDHLKAYRSRCQDLFHQEGTIILNDLRNRTALMRKIFFSWGPNVFWYKSHGISAKYNFCEVYNLKAEEYWKEATLEGKAKGFLLSVNIKRKE